MLDRTLLRLILFIATFTSIVNPCAATKQAKEVPMGQFAAKQIRHIAAYFPGRMAGSPAELLTAEYLKQQFAEMGYPVDTRTFNTRYLYTNKDSSESWRKISVTSVIASKNGDEPKQIIVMTHFDTYTPTSDDEVDKNLGGLTLQGVDDNASGVGVMLELANRMKNISTTYSLKFVATSGEELMSLGAKNYLSRMTQQERNNTVLLIDLDSLIIGDRLYLYSGHNTPPEVAKQSRDHALNIAHHYGVNVSSSKESTASLQNTHRYRCSDQNVFDDAKIPVLVLGTTHCSLGEKEGYHQRTISTAFPQGVTWHRPQYDNLQYIESHLPGRIEQRSHDSVQLLLPLIEELAQAHSKQKQNEIISGIAYQASR